MKAALIICCLVCTGYLHSQIFEHFINPNYEYYFEYDDEPGVYHTFSIVDSIEYGNSITYIPHKLAKTDTVPYNHPECFWCSELQTSPNLHGFRYNKLGASSWRFLNQNFDSLYISLSAVDSSLILTEGVLAVYIVPKDSNSLNLFGENIDVLNFRIRFYENNIPINSEIDSMDFAYSEEYGFLNFVDLKTFPNEIKTYSIKGLENYFEGPRIWSEQEFVSWNIGDTLLYRHYGSFSSLSDGGSLEQFLKYEIYDMEVTDIKTIYYAMELSHSTYSCQGCPPEPEITYQEAILEFNAEDFVLDFPLDNLHSSYVHEEYEMKDSTFNGIDRHFQIRYTTGYTKCELDSLCFSPPFEPSTNYHRYVQDLGRTYWGSWYNDGENSSTNTRELIAYYKGGEVYGELGLISSVNEIKKEVLKISPNPTQDQITVKPEIDFYEIYNLNGEMILSGSGRKIDLSNISQGIYILKAFKDDSFYSQKIIKQ